MHTHTHTQSHTPQIKVKHAREDADKAPPGSAGDATVIQLQGKLRAAEEESKGCKEELQSSKQALQKLKNAERSVVGADCAGTV